MLNDTLTGALLILLFLATPLVFAASLYFQDRNRLLPKSPHLPESDVGKAGPIAHDHYDHLVNHR